MTKIIVFPGQGSQKKGMGKDLFPQFPEEVKLANTLLGYDLTNLCLEDPERKLGKTEFTQPALFTVNAFSYMAWLARHSRPPDVVAGHSLGEYNALFAAGVITFEQGLRLVQQRGRLMATATQGGMLAVIGLDESKITHVLSSAGLDTIDIANINTPDQIVVAGPSEDLRKATPALKAVGGRAIPLNVSAAFHSRYMAPAGAAFTKRLDQIPFKAPQFPVMANVTARPYPYQSGEMASILARQISESVRWYETISWLLALPGAVIEEIGPGKVLTKMTKAIAARPISFASTPKLASSTYLQNSPRSTSVPRQALSSEESSLPNSSTPPPRMAKPGLIFLYSGHGSQYYRMGESLYYRHDFFHKTIDLCSEIAAPILGVSLAERLYHGPLASEPLVDLPLSNAANFSLGFALTRVLAKKDICADAVMGFGVGEFLAATIAGGLSLQDGLILAIRHGQLTKQHTPKGMMMAVFAGPDLINRAPTKFEGCHLASHNFKNHMILGGEEAALLRAGDYLKSKEITCQILPVDRTLHAPALDVIKPAFLNEARNLHSAPLSLPMYSPSANCWLDEIDAEGLFQAIRQTVSFRDAIQTLLPMTKTFIDLGPSGTLAAFVGYELGNRDRALTAINRFGRGMHTLETLCETLE